MQSNFNRFVLASENPKMCTVSVQTITREPLTDQSKTHEVALMFLERVDEMTTSELCEKFAKMFQAIADDYREKAATWKEQEAKNG